MSLSPRQHEILQDCVERMRLAFAIGLSSAMTSSDVAARRRCLPDKKWNKSIMKAVAMAATAGVGPEEWVGRLFLCRFPIVQKWEWVSH
jgi:hypothetical protein